MERKRANRLNYEIIVIMLRVTTLLTLGYEKIHLDKLILINFSSIV